MSTGSNEIGEFEKSPYEVKHIAWKIVDFFSIVKKLYYSYFVSPDFFFADQAWHLGLDLKRCLGDDDFEIMDLYLLAENALECSVEYNFGLKKRDGSVEKLGNGVTEKTDEAVVEFIEKSELLRRQSEFMPDNILTITCALQLRNGTTYTTSPVLENKTEPLNLISLDKLSKNFRDLFDDKDSCDVTLRVKDKEYKAHRSVLMARSSVFAANFKHDTLERQTGVITITDCDPDSFQKFLEYIYCGKLEEISLNLYYTSDKYDSEEVKVFCVQYLMKCLTIENMCEVAVFADKYDEKELFLTVQKFFNGNVYEILRRPEWNSLLAKEYRLANKLLIEMSEAKLKK